MASKREALESRRDRLIQASSKLSSISTYPAVAGASGYGVIPSDNSRKNAITTITVNVSKFGIGLILTAEPEAPNQLIIKDFQVLPNNTANPSQSAGLRSGDKIMTIDDMTYDEPRDMVNYLKNLRGPTVKISVSRS